MKHRIGQDIISADQVIGKTLIAKANVPLKRYAQASAPVIYTAKRGEIVGKVYAWVMEGSTLYWMFYDANERPYYAQHKTGIFDVKALQQQGAMTLEDIKEAKEKAESPITYTITKLLKPVTLAVAAFFVIKAFR